MSKHMSTCVQSRVAHTHTRARTHIHSPWLMGLQGAHHFAARVYSCSEQFDVTLISNYASLGRGEDVNFTCPVVRHKMILLAAANQIILFFSGAKNNHLNNKNQRERRAPQEGAQLFQSGAPSSPEGEQQSSETL